MYENCRYRTVWGANIDLPEHPFASSPEDSTETFIPAPVSAFPYHCLNSWLVMGQTFPKTAGPCMLPHGARQQPGSIHRLASLCRHNRDCWPRQAAIWIKDTKLTWAPVTSLWRSVRDPESRWTRRSHRQWVLDTSCRSSPDLLMNTATG